MELGEGADGAALPELAQLCGSSSARLRRLAAAGIVYRYDERFHIIEGFAIRPDFY